MTRISYELFRPDLARFPASLTAIAVLASIASATISIAAEPRSRAVEIRVDAGNILRTTDRTKLLGGNVAVWTSASPFLDATVREHFREIGPSIMRMPGGSYSDICFWNGNGVRRADGTVDLTKFKNGYPTIDYSRYAPSVLVNAPRGKPRTLNGDWHGNHDVKTEHDFIKAIDWRAFVCVNAGTGRPKDAAEWVRWAAGMDYPVDYWEIGNELDGGWEAGHWLDDGSELTGAMYAKRYLAFAKAMRKVDPNARIGGPACGAMPNDFAENMMRVAGKYVDFISYHTYIHGANTAEKDFFRVTIDRINLAEEVAGYRELIRRYQPAREHEIEIGITEWNLWNPGPRGSDTIGLIWTALFIGKMMEAGMDYATHFDSIGRGWHAVDERAPYPRRAAYWAFWLWQHYMGDDLLHSSVSGSDELRVFATRSKDAIFIMAANSSREESIDVSVNLKGASVGSRGRIARVTYRNYFQKPGTSDVAWSRPPTIEPIATGPDMSVSLPPFSLQVIEIPLAGRKTPATAPVPRKSKEKISLAIHLPKRAFVGDRNVFGWITATIAGTKDPYPVPLGAATLTIEGPASVDGETVSLAHAAGRFRIRPTAAGKVTVRAALGKTRAKAMLTVESSTPRQVAIWEFEEPSSVPSFKSDYSLDRNPSIRPNQRVAHITFDGKIPGEKTKRLVLGLEKFEKMVDRKNIRGVFFDIKIPKSFNCADPDANIIVVMQSPDNYWMQLGSVSLRSDQEEWKTHVFLTEDEGFFRAMPQVFNILLMINSKAAVSGAIYIDRVGLMLRG